jgi:hypothetical protein
VELEAESMSAKPILFSAPMIRAIMREIEQPGTGKTQDRQVLKVSRKQQEEWNPNLSVCPTARLVENNGLWVQFDHPRGGPYTGIRCPFVPGDLLWVRETWGVSCHPHHVNGWRDGIEYRADETRERGGGELPLYEVAVPEGVDLDDYPDGWRLSRSMPRWASRITLEVTDVRVQRLQDISEEDAKAEGVELTETVRGRRCWHASHRAAFASLWNSINDPEAWEANPWVSCISFRPHLKNIDAFIAERKVA